MTDVLDLLPLYQVTSVVIRARMDADANAGLIASDPRYIDTREGTFYHDVTEPMVIEFTRLWDALGSEVIAAAFPQTSWGDYLDEHAAVFNLVRNPAVSATGTVLFAGTPATLVATNTVVSAQPADPSQDTITFLTTASGTTGPTALPPAGVAVVGSNSGGTLAAGTYYYHVTSITTFGESKGTSDQTASTTGGLGSMAISWSAATNATGYHIYRARTPNSLGQYVGTTAGTAFTDTGFALGAEEPTIDTTAGVLLPVSASDPGTLGNVSSGAVITLETPLPAITFVTNAAAMGGGADVETDEALRDRILLQYSGQGAGNISDYMRWALEYPGVGRVFVNPTWAGAGTVEVVAMLTTGQPVAGGVVTGLQALLDPVAGQGHGLAPVGAVVTVTTSTAVPVNVIATVAFEGGYTLDGASGAIAKRAEIVAALQAYLGNLQPGQTVIFDHVKAQFFVPVGVHEVSGLTINAGTSDITMSSSAPPQISQLGTVTLT